ncbi:Retrovirus-related Pol polyprotein from transposon TNT 1-94 [Penicillium subrubescens]|uniref:Retrovirus-related Pol polyprotein from transposon TNT 1-94 n=1 Tax=Penicillium subrubescens TaxID=1316194 RepID=A0A1Q5TGV1_9EURO|nr:Retrovirus-related Pol polyprotein from transposon TNT 1-94 [Penicillium subrubescens]
MDAVNAFLNSSLKEEVYCRYPPGLGHKKSMILRLHKAVYGLRIAGKRWEDDIKEMLLLLGFQSCPDDPALYTDNHVSFADNPDRKSSEGFIFCLFGGPIEWKSRKQKTITISTTEAELLAISHAAKQLYWIKRLFSFIQFDPD